MEVPANYKLLFTEDQVHARTRELAVQISAWAATAEQATGREVLAVAVLRGAVFFFADILRYLTCSMEVGFCRASSYLVDAHKQGGKGVTLSSEQPDVRGRAILVVDDICDTGATLAKLRDEFRQRGAEDIRAVVMVNRKTAPKPVMPDWFAFEHEGDEWLVGYGLDDCNRNANLRDVYIIKDL